MKKQILDCAADLVSGFLYYDRKEDGDLPLDAIEDSIKKGEITVEEIVLTFKTELIKRLKN